MRFVLLVDRRQYFSAQPGDVEIEHHFVTAGRPESIVILRTKSESALIEFVKTHIKESEYVLLPAIEAEKFDTEQVEMRQSVEY